MAKKFDPKAKAKKQKIIAAVLGVLLLGVLAYEVPSLMKSMNKKPPAASVAAGVLPRVLAPVAGGPVAVDPRRHACRHDSYRFRPTGPGREWTAPVVRPILEQGPVCSAGGCHGHRRRPRHRSQPAAAAKPPNRPADDPVDHPHDSASAGTRAQPELGPDLGQRHDRTVDLSKTFPSSDPVFRLVALTRTTAKIGIAGGSLSTGDGTTTLTKGKKVTLMNTADGTRYELSSLRPLPVSLAAPHPPARPCDQALFHSHTGTERHVRKPRVGWHPKGLRNCPYPRPTQPQVRVPSVPGVGVGRSEALQKRVLAGQKPIGDRNLPPARDAELLAKDVTVRLRRSRRDAQPLADLVVREARGDQLHDLTLPLGDLQGSPAQYLCHGADATSAVAWRT